MPENEELSNDFRKFFKMPTSPVSITIHNREIDGESPAEATRFCRFAREAANLRKSFVVREEDLSNFTARIILGFDEPKYVEVYPRVEPPETEAVSVKPLELEDGEPDVIVLISDPATLMEVLQVYHQMSGERLESNCTSMESAISGEATAFPYMEGRPNLTLLCGGARSIGGFEDDELAMGLPYGTFVRLVDQLSEPSVTDALCGCMMDDLPGHLVEAFEGMDFDKSTDHLHGYYRGRALRLYLDQDEGGSVKRMTVYLPLKFESEAQVVEAMEVAKPMIAGVGFANKRDNWLDIGIMKEYEEGLEKMAVDDENFENKLRIIFDEFLQIADKVEVASESVTD